MQCKVILSGRNIYKEIILPSNYSKISVGTGTDCDIRLPQRVFFVPFSLNFNQEENVWRVSCTGEVYFASNTVNKFPQVMLKHGDEYVLKYKSSNIEFLCVNYLIDFDENIHTYDMYINLQGKRKVIIGGCENADIGLESEFVGDSYVVLSLMGDKAAIEDINSYYGVYVNGVRIKKKMEIKNYSFFSIAYCSFFFKNGKLYTSKKNKLTVKGLKTKDVSEQKDCQNYPRFNRNSRILPEVQKGSIPILAPPEKPQKQNENLFLSLFPAITMVILTVLLRGSMGGTSYLAFSVCSMGVGVITSIIAFISNHKRYKKDCEHRVEAYQNYIARKREEIQTEREKEYEQLNEIYFDFEKEKKLVKTFSSGLFDRTLEDEDFASVFLGRGYRKSARQVDYQKQEKLEIDDSLAELPVKVAEDFSVIANAPICVPLMQNDVVGVVGSVQNCYSMLKNMTYDLAIRHYPDDLHFYYICSEENVAQLKWVRWLPHVRNRKSGMNHIACDAASKNAIFEELFILLSVTEEIKEGTHFAGYHVIFVFDDLGILKHPLSQYMDGAKKKGFTFVFFKREKGMLPQNCESIIYLETFGKKGALIDTANRENTVEFSYTTITDEEAVQTAFKLSPVYCDEVSLEGGLVRNYSFYQMLNIFNAEEIDLRSNWDSDEIYHTLSAPLGINAKNEIVYLDLHENAHGPHGLVAGTTGSGKSEILQSYILSMAVKYHPDDVGFVIIDFKGGGMANQFADLPHLRGTITNIDGREIERSLKSIRAELQKRQRLFAEYNVNKIDDYIRKYRTGETQTALPHLIIVVDEFAELKADQPEFMKELISAARIGRSLGVHLILATQKPAGQVDDQIWSNSRFKLCLKVQDKEDSNEVLKSPLAAEIREPGRAYLQVGNNEIFTLFQSAYSGGSVFTDENAGIHEFELSEVNIWGKKKLIYQQKRKKSDTVSGNSKQLEAIVRYVKNYFEQNRIKKLPDICLPPLPDVILYPEEHVKILNGCVDIGIYDDPENQVQSSYLLDISTKNTFILGSSQYGKTNILQSIMRTVIETMTPQEANIYIIDFGSRILKNYEQAAHVGGVVCSNEDEKLKNLFKFISSEIMNRKEALAGVGVSSYVAYREAGYLNLPQIYLVIDNLTALMELYLEDDDTLLVFIREGVSVGITTIVANAQTSGISYKYLSNFANKVVLHCNDSSEYNSIFDYVTLHPKDVPGRCILEIEKRILECQTYLAFAGDKEIDRVAKIRNMIEKINDQNINKKAKMIPYIPTLLFRETLQKDFDAYTDGYRIPVGLTYAEVEPFYFRMNQMGAFGICGKEGSGHRNFIEYMMEILEKNSGQYPTEVCIFDDITHKYQNLKESGIVTMYTLDADKAVDTINEWRERLADRYQSLMEEGFMKDNTLLLMIVQNNDVAKVISDNLTSQEQYNEILTRFRSLNVCIIFANYENASISYDAPEPLHMIKEEQHLLFLDNLANLKVFDPDYEALKVNRKKIGSGDAYYIKGNDVTKLKMVLNS